MGALGGGGLYACAFFLFEWPRAAHPPQINKQKQGHGMNPKTETRIAGCGEQVANTACFFVLS